MPANKDGKTPTRISVTFSSTLRRLHQPLTALSVSTQSTDGSTGFCFR